MRECKKKNASFFLFCVRQDTHLEPGAGAAARARGAVRGLAAAKEDIVDSL